MINNENMDFSTGYRDRYRLQGLGMNLTQGHNSFMALCQVEQAEGALANEHV